jgi:2,4-dienoyl-CoA reductase (NADPH2)
MLNKFGVTVHLDTLADANRLATFDHVVVATGIVPRTPDLPGIGHAKVVSYVDLIEGRKKAGERVALIGAGGIGFDVAEFLSHPGGDEDPIVLFQHEWGIDAQMHSRGGVMPPHSPRSSRQIWLLQRKPTKVGEGLAKTTGWARRLLLQRRGVQMLAGVEYRKIDDAGFHIRVDEVDRVLEVDTVVICAGQEPRRDLVAALADVGVPCTVIGGADVAVELDARRAIAQGTNVGITL